MVVSGRLTTAEAASVDLDRLLKFWEGPAGVAIRTRRADVHRELEFTAAFSVSELDRYVRRDEFETPVRAEPEDVVIVQGIVDLAVIGKEDLWILDYKTDNVAPAEITDRARQYEPQVQLYRLALERTFRRPAARVWLHFIRPNQTIAFL